MYLEVVQDFLDAQINREEIEIKAKISMGVDEQVEYRRASMAGDCPRKLAFFKLNSPRPIMATRGSATLATGAWLHWMIMEWARRGYSLKTREFTLKTEIEEEISKPLTLPSGYELKSVHLDMESNHSKFGIGVGEIKTLSNWSFLEMVNGEIDPKYKVQAALYIRAAKASHVFFWPYRKETSDLRERVFFDKIGGSIRSSFNSKDVSYLNNENDVALDVDAIIDDIDEKYVLIETMATESQVLHTFPEACDPYHCDNRRRNCSKCGGTGRVIRPELKFPCSYCPFMALCWEINETKVSEGKPHYYL